jgi:hypothetical protein
MVKTIHNLTITCGYWRSQVALSFRFSEGAHEWKRVIRVGWSEIEAVIGMPRWLSHLFCSLFRIGGPRTVGERETDPPIDHSELAKGLPLGYPRH